MHEEQYKKIKLDFKANLDNCGLPTIEYIKL